MGPEVLLKDAAINAGDVDLLRLTDDPHEVVRIVQAIRDAAEVAPHGGTGYRSATDGGISGTPVRERHLDQPVTDPDG